jgi:hypothetical protein
MTDIRKLEIFDSILMKRGLSKPRDLEQWLVGAGVSFTKAGDSIPDEVYTLENAYNIKIVANGSNKDTFLTMVLEALSGTLVFNNIENEKVFWKYAVLRLVDEFGVKLPKIILPKSIQFDTKMKDKHKSN